MIRKIVNKKYTKFIYLGLLGIIFFFTYKFFDINAISNLFEIIQKDFALSSFYLIILLFILRSISILIPILPGTYCSVIAGYLFGIRNGLGIIFIADFISCSLSFFISRRFGRTYVSKLLGKRQMKKVESISKQYLANNFFLMTGLLLTSWFDFVCYAIGLTKISWKRFMPSLIFSIVISDIPFVAAGYALNTIKNVSLQQILNGEISIISGNYLVLLVVSASLIFGLGLLNIFIKKHTNKV